MKQLFYKVFPKYRIVEKNVNGKVTFQIQEIVMPFKYFTYEDKFPSFDSAKNQIDVWEKEETAVVKVHKV